MPEFQTVDVKIINEIPSVSFNDQKSDSLRGKVCQLLSVGVFGNRNADPSLGAKVVVIGDIAVGKTSLINRYRYSMFTSNYKSTIGVDFAILKSKIFGLPFQLQIWDTAGTERFKSLAPAYYRNANAILIAFDANDPNSLASCNEWHRAALSSSYERSPLIFLVGTKMDTGSETQSITLEKAKSFAEEIGAELWLTSSKAGKNVEALFHRVSISCLVSTLSSVNVSCQPPTAKQIGPRIDLNDENLYEKVKCARCL